MDGDKDSTVKYFFHTDMLGSTVLVTDKDGNTVWTGDVTPFGEKVNGEGSFEGAVRFTGKEYDEDTGLYYFNARWYDEKSGRFVSEDTYAGEASDSSTLNRYTYGTGNPLRHIDPTGNSTEEAQDNLSSMLKPVAEVMRGMLNIFWRDSLVASSTAKNPNGNPDVIEAQASLTMLGYNLGEAGVDGLAGTNTTGAIKEFQLAMGLNPTGEIDEKTKSVMTEAVAAGMTRDTINKLAIAAGRGATDISDRGVQFIAIYETGDGQPDLTVYPDLGKKPTIGYGHLVKEGESFPNGITKEQALALMRNDLQEAVDRVRAAITVPLTQEQFDALVSLSYNVGKIGPSLAAAINQGRYSEVESRIKAYKYVGKTVYQGLVNRRADEWELYATGDYVRNH